MNRWEYCNCFFCCCFLVNEITFCRFNIPLLPLQNFQNNMELSRWHLYTNFTRGARPGQGQCFLQRGHEVILWCPRARLKLNSSRLMQSKAVKLFCLGTKDVTRNVIFDEYHRKKLVTWQLQGPWILVEAIDYFLHNQYLPFGSPVPYHHKKLIIFIIIVDTLFGGGQQGVTGALTPKLPVSCWKWHRLVYYMPWFALVHHKSKDI